MTEIMTKLNVNNAEIREPLPQVVKGATCRTFLLAISLLSPPDYSQLANAIYKHENSIKFPYGCEHRVNGKLVGYPEPVARAICINLCRNAYSNWDGKGDYFQSLNKIYAQDSRWFLSVEKLYNQQNKTKGLKNETP